MKTMTCADMGGPCTFEMKAETKDEMMKQGMDHLHSMTDEAHMKIVKDMPTLSAEENAKWQASVDAAWEAAPTV